MIGEISTLSISEQMNRKGFMWGELVQGRNLSGF